MTRQGVTRGRRAAIAVVVAAATAVGASFGPAEAPAETVATTVTEPAAWRAVVPATPRSPRKGPALGGHRVGLFVDGGHCVGGPKPRFDRATVVELPETSRRRYKAAVITAYRSWPAATLTLKGSGYVTGCFPARNATIFHRVRTKRPVEGLRLFDGSFSPPRQVWPLAGAGSKLAR